MKNTSIGTLRAIVLWRWYLQNVIISNGIILGGNKLKQGSYWESSLRWFREEDACDYHQTNGGKGLKIDHSRHIMILMCSEKARLKIWWGNRNQWIQNGKLFNKLSFIVFRYGEVHKSEDNWTAIANIVCYSVSKKSGHATATWRCTRVRLEAEGARGQHEMGSLLWFPWERQGRVSRFRVD